MIFTFLLVVQAIIATVLVTVILMQRSEGGGLGVGGSPSGLMSARGAADFLTRATTILATLFVGLSVVMAVLASTQHAPSTIDTSLAKGAAASQNSAPLAGNGIGTGNGGVDPLAGAAQSVNGGAPAAAGNASAEAGTRTDTGTGSGVPLAK